MQEQNEQLTTERDELREWKKNFLALIGDNAGRKRDRLGSVSVSSEASAVENGVKRRKVSHNVVESIEALEASKAKSESGSRGPRSPGRLTPVSQTSESTVSHRHLDGTAAPENSRSGILHEQRKRGDSWRPPDMQRHPPAMSSGIHSLNPNAILTHAVRKSSYVFDMFMIELGISEKECSRLKTSFTTMFEYEDMSVSSMIKRIDRAIIGKFASKEQPPCLLARLFSKRFLYFERNGDLATECDACLGRVSCMWAEHLPQVDTGFLPRDVFGRVPSRADRRVPGSDKDWVLPKTNLTQLVRGKEVRWTLRRFSMRQRVNAASVEESDH